MKPTKILPICDRLAAAIEETKAGCPRCNGTGLVEVTIAMGRQFARECLAEKCGFENGGYITELPEPPEPSGPCRKCGGATRWTLMECDESA